MNIISQLLIAYRREHDLIQKDLATELSHYSNEFNALNEVTLSRWETGKTAPPPLKKKLLLLFFTKAQCFGSGNACNDIAVKAYKNLYKHLTAVLTRKYQYLIGNLPEAPTEKHSLEDLKKFSNAEEHIEHIIDIEVATNAANYYSATPTILEQWCNHPASFSLIAERKRQHLGHFIMLKIKNHVAEEIALHTRSEFDLGPNDFCDIDENGTYYIHALYGRNPKIAAELNVKAYLHLLNHINTVDNLMIFSTRKDGRLLTKDYGIKEVACGTDEKYDVQWHGMLSPVEDILFSDTVLKLVF